MPRRLILWDIDGTLLTTGPAGRRALETGARAAADLAEVPSVDMSGKTDPQIVREILDCAGLAGEEIERVLPVALEHAERALASETHLMLAEGKVHPGVADALCALADVEGVRQTLLTGNVWRNAAVKVRVFGLDTFFDAEVGAYGDDHADRNYLVPIARERARRLRNEDYAPDEVWVVGDTPNDVRCARAGGVRCLIVGTGHAGPDAVRDLEADAVLDDLSDTDVVLKILLGT